MLKKFINKSSEFLAGFGMAVLVLGFAGVVTASTFSGPSNQPPNGFISPTFDGLTINGDLTVNPGVGDGVYMEDVYIQGLETNRIGGCWGCPDKDLYGNGSQYLKIASPYMDITGQDIYIGGISSADQVTIKSHVKARSIGYMYEVSSSRSMPTYYVGWKGAKTVSCPSSTYMVSCNAYLSSPDFGFSYEGTKVIGNTCYAYARQAKSSASNNTLEVEAQCWDTDNYYNKNY